jgi:hypothetical protein
MTHGILKSATMTITFVLAVTGIALGQASPSLIFPDTAHEVQVVSADKCRSKLPCGHVLPESDSLARLVLEELRLPFHREVITVSQCLRNFAGDPTSPNVLFVSEREGGYASRGLALKEDRKVRELPDLRYVELVLDPQSVRQGDLDIYSHELGHVMMWTVWPARPEGRSPKQHVSMGITDEFMAFSEGWGIQFQRLAYDAIPRYQQIRRDQLDYKRDTRWLWHSNLDTRLRLDAVASNDYIRRKVLPQVDTTGMSIKDLIFLDHTSPLFDPCRLKNAQEMLACEGVIATLFYRINTDSLLQHSYRDAAFYVPFLRGPIPGGSKPQDIFTPLENVLLKSAFVMHSMKDRLNERSSPFLEFINEWCTIFPEDKEELLSVFLGTTVGRTVTDSLGAIYEKMAYAGMIGNINEYRRLRKEYDDALARLKTDVLAKRVAFDANVGPQLWVENSDLSIPVSLFSPEPKFPLNINLNTASVFDLASFRGISIAQAQSIIRARDQQGWFQSMDDARQHGFAY